MAVFSTNQVRLFYVAKAVDTLAKDSAAGTIEVKSVKDAIDPQVYFAYAGKGSNMKSDYIPVKSINYAVAKKAATLQDKLTKVVVKLDPDVNGGEPLVGQDYILNITLRQFYGMSDEDQYFKFGCVHVTKGMDASAFYKKLAESLTLNFSREIGEYLTFTAAADSLTIQEVEQPWRLGTMKQERVYFEVLPSTISADGGELVWGTVEKSTNGTIGNGKKIADLEWFCMGERGDQYRMNGWPNVVYTDYMVDPDKEYDVLEIHYAYTDEGVNSYRSEKEITIVAETGTVMETLITNFNTATGLSVTLA